jgi:hypothetical protein
MKGNFITLVRFFFAVAVQMKRSRREAVKANRQPSVEESNAA